MRRGLAILALTAAAAAGPVWAQQQGNPALNDFPTEARAEYVFACMAVNGQTPEMLRRCSCSVDVVASIIPYERYVEAETVLALRQVAGERVSPMRSAPVANELVQTLRRAQAEGAVRCF